MASVVPFLGMRFLDADLDGVRRGIARLLASGTYAYAVTPNVDHVVTYHHGEDEDLRAAYDGAALHICDSRILSVLARPSGRRLVPCPGSDLTQDLLSRSLEPKIRMAVIGPSGASFRRLRTRFPRARLSHIESGARLRPGSAEWHDTLARTRDAEWDILFICLSFPKQEKFARALGVAGRQHGFALCVGASIDFLTGQQKRAPQAMQRAGLEWLHRLAVNPRRMWRRYLVRGPSIVSLTARQYVDDARRALKVNRAD